LLNHNNPRVRVLAIASLTSRNHPDLFTLILPHLSDTTTVEYYDFDVGGLACPADLMLDYAARNFTKEQKDSIVNLILYQFPHLEKTLNEILVFKSPLYKDYKAVRQMASSGDNLYAKVALSRYKKTEDLELIGSVMCSKRVNGVMVGYLAIENFPHPSFKAPMLKAGKELNMGEIGGGDEFLFRALASFMILKSKEPAGLEGTNKVMSPSRQSTPLLVPASPYVFKIQLDQEVTPTTKRTQNTNKGVG